MPYIKQEHRQELGDRAISNPGELNYIITSLFDSYLEEHGLSYATINSIIGAVECAKMELYRRIAVPYENIKIKENGDAYIWAQGELWSYSSTEQK